MHVNIKHVLIGKTGLRGNLKVKEWAMFKAPDLLPCTSYALELSVMINLTDGFKMV